VIEEKAAGKDVIDTLEREVYGIEPYKPKSTSKQERLIAGLSLWEQGRVHLPHPMHASTTDADYSWVKELYVPELLTFPGAAHDDQVDATSQALLWIMANGPGEGAYMKVLG
jgi:predicted phage terminase large subunit-like protein